MCGGGGGWGGGSNFEFYYFLVWGKGNYFWGIGHLQVLFGVTFKTDYFLGSIKVPGIFFFFFFFFFVGGVGVGVGGAVL